jgi:glycolate oxidase iron-sulfur subunit
MTKPLTVIEPNTQREIAPAARAPEMPKPAINLDPRVYARGLSCVHCGLCLPACPTYTQNGDESDSPRGRIQIMLGLADGRIDATPGAIEHLDCCLDCRACETACPSGVVYHELIEETRAKLREKFPQRGGRLIEWLFLNVLTRPTRLKLALLPPRILQKIGVYGLLRKSGIMNLLPAGLRKMESMLPPTGTIWPGRLPETTGPKGESKAKVAFLQGCVGGVMFADVNRQAIDLLTLAGAQVHVPRSQGCCGAIHHHNGLHDDAAAMARNNIDALEDADYITSTIAGCGAALREYDLLLRDDPDYAERARRFAAKVRDISEVLLELGLPPPKFPVAETATIHDACHLIHAQKVAPQPRQLLAAISGLTLKPLPENDMCCGAAGTYNLTHPKMAGDLAERKVTHVASTGASLCITGNVGCAMHIQSHATATKRPILVVHPVTLLHRAHFG